MAVALGALRSAVHHGSSTLIMVSGAPGIGKTAMLGEVCRQAARMRLRVASGRCEPIRQVSPGAPVIAALRTGRSPLADAGEYAQIVELDFFPRFDGGPGRIKWPHVSINTMEKLSDVPDMQYAALQG